MTLLVLDASVVAAWYIPSQATQSATALLLQTPRPQWRAPHCFAYEVANLILRQERRGALEVQAVEKVLADVDSFGVVLEPPPGDPQMALALHLARHHGLSLFDGFYLHLALELGVPLVTRDRLLAVAASSEGCDVIDVRAAS